MSKDTPVYDGSGVFIVDTGMSIPEGSYTVLTKTIDRGYRAYLRHQKKENLTVTDPAQHRQWKAGRVIASVETLAQVESASNYIDFASELGFPCIYTAVALRHDLDTRREELS